MDVDLDEFNKSDVSESVRSVMCEVCARNEAKYTCPRCEVRTCCLECVKIHKKELECSGLRDKVKFKKLTNFNNIDLLNDYRLLEETARVVSKSVKLPPVSCFNPMKGMLPADLYRLRGTALSRGVHLQFLPPSFTRHKTNTTFLDHQAQQLYWRVDWIFPQAGKISFTDERILDSSVLSSCIHKYIEPDGIGYPALSFYQSAGYSGIKLLLKAERTSNRYYLLDPSSTLRANLSGKQIIEFPVIYVVLNYHMYSFNIFTEEEEQAMQKRPRRRHYQHKNKTVFKNNFLFGDNTEEGNEKASDIEGIPTTDTVSTSYNSPNYPHNNRRQHFGRGRGRRRRFGRRNNDSSERSINGRLSSNLKLVHI